MIRWEERGADQEIAQYKRAKVAILAQRQRPAEHTNRARGADRLKRVGMPPLKAVQQRQQQTTLALQRRRSIEAWPLAAQKRRSDDQQQRTGWSEHHGRWGSCGT